MAWSSLVMTIEARACARNYTRREGARIGTAGWPLSGSFTASLPPPSLRRSGVLVAANQDDGSGHCPDP